MAASLRDVQALNALAADHFQQNDLKQASVALSHAIAKLSWCVLEEDDHEEQGKHSSPPISKGHPNLQQTSSSSLRAPQHSPSSSMRIYASASPQECSELLKMNNKEFFPHAFRFDFLMGSNTTGTLLDHTSLLAPIPNSSQHHPGCAMVCLFNLGLCFHKEYRRLEQERSDNKTRLLLKAARCYEQAYSVASTLLNEMTNLQGQQQEEQEQEQRIQSFSLLQPPTCLQVLMAACTNATLACGELGQQLQVVEWNNRLHLLLEAARSLPLMDCPFLQFFAVHAILYGFERPTAPAA